MIEIMKDSQPAAIVEQLKSLAEQAGFDEAHLLTLFVVDPMITAEFTSAQLMVESTINILKAMTDADYMANVIKHPEQDILVVGFKIVMPENTFMVPGQVGTV